MSTKLRARMFSTLQPAGWEPEIKHARLALDDISRDKGKDNGDPKGQHVVN